MSELNSTQDEILAAVLQTHDSVGLRNELKRQQFNIGNDVTAQTLQPNKLYVFTGRTADLAITLADVTYADQQYANEYHLIIEVGDTLPTITFPAFVEWPVGALELAALTKVEISILNNQAIWV